MKPGVARTLVLAVGQPPGWLAGRLPLDDGAHDATAWLSPDVDADAALELLFPVAAERTAAAPANPAVNKAGVEGAELLTPPADTGPVQLRL